ncbi:MAG: hypothetical protein Q9195_001480 [Heterodermia aff. obscurata]
MHIVYNRIRHHNQDKDTFPPILTISFQTQVPIPHPPINPIIPPPFLPCFQTPFQYKKMNWLSRTLFGIPTPATANSPPPDDAEARSPDTASWHGTSPRGSPSDTASGAGASPRGSLSDADSEGSSNWSTLSVSQHSERVAQKRRSLPRLRTSDPSGPLGPRGGGDSRSHARKAGLVSQARSRPKASSISLSPGTNVIDPTSPRMRFKFANPDVSPPATSEAANDDVLPTAPDVFDGQTQLTEHYPVQHGQEPPQDFSQYMKQAEEEQGDLRKQIQDLANIAHEDRRGYDDDIRRRDLEIEALRKKVEEMAFQEENVGPASSVRKYLRQNGTMQRSSSVPLDPKPYESSVPNNNPTPNNVRQSSDSLAARKQQLRTPKAEETEYRPSHTAKELRQTLVEMILLRVEVAELYKEWQSMASLAATALDESSVLMSGILMAQSLFYRGVALYRLGFYWEAATTFEDSKHHTESHTEERVEVERWLEKAKQAQVAAQSAVSRQSSVFDPSTPVKLRTDSFPIANALTALKDELNFDSDFDSVRGFGSRTPSVQSLLASAVEGSGSRAPSVQSLPPSAVESPQERQPRSPERGPEVRDPRLRKSSLDRRLSGGRQHMYSPLRRTPDTPRIPPSPLGPQRQRTMTDNVVSAPKNQRPAPLRMASTGTKPLQGQRGFADQVARRFANEGRPPSSPLARYIDTSGTNDGPNRTASESLRYSAMVRNAKTADARRQSQQLRGIDAFLDGPAPRRASLLGREIQQIQFGNEADLDTIDEASEASAEHVRNDKGPESKQDMQTELDGLLSDSRSSKGDKSAGKAPMPSNLEHGKQLADKLQALADQQDERMSPGTRAVAELGFGDELPLQGDDSHTKIYAIPPVQSHHHIEDEKAQEVEGKEDLNGARREPDRNAEYLANLEKDGEAIPQEALEFNSENAEQFSTEPEAGISEQASINDVSSDAGNQSGTVVEAPVEKGGPDDLYDVEDGYVAPTPGPASSVSTLVAETGEDSDVGNTEWEVVPREANASSSPNEPLNVAEGAAGPGPGIHIVQEREQEAEHPLEMMDEEKVAGTTDTEPPVGRVDEENSAGQEGAMKESDGTSEAMKDEEETNQLQQPGQSPIFDQGKGNSSKKTKKRKKKSKR